MCVCDMNCDPRFSMFPLSKRFELLRASLSFVFMKECCSIGPTDSTFPQTRLSLSKISVTEGQLKESIKDVKEVECLHMNK